MHASTILYSLVLLQGAMASPISDSTVGVETRDIEPRAPALGDFPFPKLPAVKRKGQGGGSDCPTQTNLCSSGTPYCCTTDGNGVQSCSNSEVCTSRVICCNNNGGYQICIGDIDFNMPVTINININKGNIKGGK
ncbi:Hypothetical protein NCS54_01450900 [Fusarium falciforme]|uniref:Hypothetical protein n=1 Tax=Fusarium falciforme TaxID=195108 RepID=UPI0023006910|nr:Hypothetical protein NCS54_01450900 [Fusarium falciforme]WAO96822.1 Hypothetical protein NCS54_01450900 [Fusarium falciforme]